MKRSVLLALLAALSSGPSCKCKSEVPERLPTAALASADRLRADEQLPNSEAVYGIPIPKGLRVVRRFAESVYLVGSGSPEELGTYFKEYLDTAEVQLEKNGLTFPRAFIKGDPLKHIYRIEIERASATTTKVKLADITPPPLTPQLTETQRWEQVGMNPDGTLKDRLQRD